MTDQLCGGRGLPEEGKPLIFWTETHPPTPGAFRKHLGFVRQSYPAEFTPSEVLGWAYLSEVRAAPKMIAALEDLICAAGAVLSTNAAINAEGAAKWSSTMAHNLGVLFKERDDAKQALADAKGGA